MKWIKKGYDEFRKGKFGNGGQNIYVSAKGTLQRIYNFDVNNDGYVDLPIANSHAMNEKPPIFVFDELNPLAVNKNLDFQLVCDDKDIEIYADKGEIRRVICNLCGNAINYTPEGGKVTVTIKNEDSDLIFSVADNGPGIPAEDIPNMFQRFSQGTSKKRSTGTGLGLYLSRQIIESHGGKIWLESVLNKGSEFSFILTDTVRVKEKNGV